MKLWKEFLANPYKFLWSRTGGREWTHIMRDFAHQNPMLILFIGVALGIWLHSWFEWRDLIIAFTFLLLGHLFWGTKYKKGQSG